MNANNDAPNEVTGLVGGMNQNTETVTILASLRNAVSTLTAWIEELIVRLDKESSSAQQPIERPSRFKCPKCGASMTLRIEEIEKFERERKR